jgi:hypothetical protein
MNDTPTHPETDETASEQTRVDLLISRIVDQEASDEDWTLFRAAAATDGRLWRTLAETQAAQRRLDEAMEPLLDVAHEVPLPDVSPAAPVVIRWPSWAGWAAAALLAIAWFMTGPRPDVPDASNGTGPMTAGTFMNPIPIPGDGMITTTTPQEMLTGYLQSEHVVGQGDPYVLETVETEEGTQVLIVRPIFERIQLAPSYQPYVTEDGTVNFRRVSPPPARLIDNSL